MPLEILIPSDLADINSDLTALLASVDGLSQRVDSLEATISTSPPSSDTQQLVQRLDDLEQRILQVEQQLQQQEEDTQVATYAIAANGNYPDSDGVKVRGSRTLIIENPAGATVKIQINPEKDDPQEADWVTISDGTFTSAAAKRILFDVTARVRVNITNYASAFEVTL